jgi:DHA2 family multidrug resistance protein
MAASATVLPKARALQVAQAIAGATPSALSNSPLLGILGVIMGAGIVTLAGRMITLGVADLKGSVGIGFDDGAWIGSAFNIGLMLIKPGSLMPAMQLSDRDLNAVTDYLETLR